jgi:hypothetical protein
LCFFLRLLVAFLPFIDAHTFPLYQKGRAGGTWGYPNKRDAAWVIGELPIKKMYFHFLFPALKIQDKFEWKF